jgi:hypothetical protein
MPTVLQLRRGTTAQNNAFTGSAGELTFNTTTGSVRAHDGTTAGGAEMMKTDGSNSGSSINFAGDIHTSAQGDIRFLDADKSNFVAFQAPSTISANVTWTLPNADAGVSGYALVSDSAGTLSWAAAGATISQDEATNTNFNLYFASTTSGALTSVKYDSGVHYNPSTGTLTSSVVDTTTLKIGSTSVTATATELNYVDGVTSAIQTQLDAKAPLASPALTGTATAVNLTLSGDLTVNGTTTTVNTTNLVVSDNLIELNNGAASNANDSGIVIERGSTGDNAFMGWDESADKFVMGTTTATGASTGDLTITAGTLVLNTVESVTGTFSGNVSASHMNVTNSVQASTLNSSTVTASTGTFSGNVTAAYFSGTATQALYADLAENYDADDNYAPGTVLIFGGEAEVTIATTSHDTRVAGIVSTNPAYLMNKENGNTTIGLTGRVPCQVKGPVDKGTLLVTSETPGVAQALNDAYYKPGCVIGKSMGKIDNSSIEVIEVAVGRF